MRASFPLPNTFTYETLYSHLNASRIEGQVGWSIDSEIHAEFPEREALTEAERAAVAAHVAAYAHVPTWTAVRTLRAPLLAEADVRINKAEDNSQNTATLRAYRQALRDVTKQADPLNVIWPTKPW